MDVPTDVLVKILLLLSPICRRRLRLVCRLWRDLVHERTPKIQIAPARPLIETVYPRAYIVDDVQGRGGCTPLWTTGHDEAYTAMQLVGSCNGLLCLCDNHRPGGAITLVNPATGEALGLPPIPGAGRLSRPKTGWHHAYGFAYHSVTGQYKIVRASSDEDKVQVFALGEASSWRDVPAPDGRCRLDAGVVGLDGAAYWVALSEKGAERIMSLDLEDCSVASIESPPEPIRHLAEVRGKLAAVISDGVMAHEKIQVAIAYIFLLTLFVY
jgi:F-box interacting protein